MRKWLADTLLQFCVKQGYTAIMFATEGEVMRWQCASDYEGYVEIFEEHLYLALRHTCAEECDNYRRYLIALRPEKQGEVFVRIGLHRCEPKVIWVTMCALDTLDEVQLMVMWQALWRYAEWPTLDHYSLGKTRAIEV